MNVRKFFQSFRYAMEGILTALKEQNFKFHLVSAIIVILAGLLTGLTAVEWSIILMVIFLVIGAELINTAIERVVDLASPEFHPIAKQAKDVAAGAVLVFALASVIIGLLIFLPKWF
ncbi:MULTISPECIES: diacylglycerol kinase family protein [Solibacillus]|uniref:Diacylglycerol kinase family protein n=1 Tax=Solibacillus merdavium TaxID=2762218 RepID=A0ABR8XIU4_9BACL|nr:diacylglycerol kinase family protein [Solibacillus merdavium]MBD8031861.1 diacylglycerol kinase family protein [Solibacillus merdavium]